VGRSRPLSIPTGVVWLLGLLLLSPAARADSARERVAEGNRAFAGGDYEGALSAYDEASVAAPESPRIEFDRGAALYKQGDFAKASEAFEKSALRTRDLALEARCHYNLGNCAFREAERQKDSDLKKALAALEKSVRHYREAIERDPTLADAAHNIEVARLTMKQILDEIKKRQEEQKKRQEKEKATQEKLKQLVERQENAIKKNEQLAKDKKEKGASADAQRRAKDLADEQRKLKEDTRDLADRMAKNQAQPSPDPRKQKLDQAASEQAKAQDRLEKDDLDSARAAQEKALQALKDAQKSSNGSKKKAAGGEQSRQPKRQEPKRQPKPQESKGDQKRKREQVAAARAQTARDIIDEEKASRQRRAIRAPGGFRSVDKDW